MHVREEKCLLLFHKLFYRHIAKTIYFIENFQSLKKIESIVKMQIFEFNSTSFSAISKISDVPHDNINKKNYLQSKRKKLN